MTTSQIGPGDLEAMRQQFKGKKSYHVPLTPDTIDELRENLEHLRERQIPAIFMPAHGRRDIAVALVLAGTTPDRRPLRGMERHNVPLTPDTIDELRENLEHLRDGRTPATFMTAEGQRDVVVAVVRADTTLRHLLDRSDFSEVAADN